MFVLSASHAFELMQTCHANLTTTLYFVPPVAKMSAITRQLLGGVAEEEFIFG